jgi:hypothetical protein
MMTPQTLNELAELGMTPETLAERQAKVATMLHPNATAAADPAAPRTRKPRSDRGTTRAPKPSPAATEPLPAGAITQEQADTIKFLAGRVCEAREALAAAHETLERAQHLFNDSIDSLTK